MNTISICESERYYFNKNNNSTKFNNNKENTVNMEFNDKKKNIYENVYIKKNNKLSSRKKNTSESVDIKKNNSSKYYYKNKQDKQDDKFRPFRFEEDQIDFELSLDEIEKSFNEYSLDLLKYNQLRTADTIEYNCEDYKPVLYEEEQLQFELSLEENENSFDEMSLDLFLYCQLDDDINNMNVDIQAYENKVELEFEYSDDD